MTKLRSKMVDRY